MRANLSCCLDLIDNGQYKSTNRNVVLVPHERSHDIMRILENPCMLLPEALKMRAIVGLGRRSWAIGMNQMLHLVCSGTPDPT